jgi:hypothetical protein
MSSIHSKQLPIDAYGTIEFQDGPHTSKAQVLTSQENCRMRNTVVQENKEVVTERDDISRILIFLCFI